MSLATRERAIAVLVPGVVALTCALVLLWPALGRGNLLYRDFVQLPSPHLGPAVLGTDGQPPRAVPLDAVTTVLAAWVPTGVQQQLMLVLAAMGGGWGVGVLVRGHGLAASTVAAALGVWSPAAVERLLVGQPPILLAISTAPWLVVALRARGRGRALGIVLAALPAALTPWGGVLAASIVGTGLWCTRRGRRPGEVLLLVGASVLWCLPWVVVALRGPDGAGERSGAAAFAVRSGTPGRLLDVLTGGGIWAQGATLSSRGGALALGSSAVLLVAALLVATTAPRHRVLLLASVLGPPAVALLLAGPLAPAWASAQVLPGVGIVRDTHRLLGLSALAEAGLVGVGAARLLRRVPGPRPVLVGATVLVMVSLTVLTAPDAASRLHGAYRPVQVPAGVARAADVIGERRALVLPDQPLRLQGWAGEQPFLDPLPLALRGPAVTSRELRVERDGRTIVVAPSTHADLVQAWRRGDIEALRSTGIEAVALWTDTPGWRADLPAPGIPVAPEPIDGPILVWLIPPR